MKNQLKKLYRFINTAGKATYIGGGNYEQNPERPGFLELVYKDNDWQYRDSYTGFYRSRGTETVRHQGKVVWVSQYGGGIENGFEKRAKDVFDFLKVAMLHKDNSIHQSFRGPSKFTDGDWGYTYQQEGGVEEFSGFEEIKYKDQIVFTHRIIGGVVVNQEIS